MSPREFTDADRTRKKRRIELPENPADLSPEGLADLEQAVLAAVKDGYIACPAAWKVAYQENQSRGGYIQFTRADFQPDPKAGGLPAEEILLQVAVYNWDPKGDIHAYLEHRYQAWESSSIGFSEEKRWT